MSDLLPITLQEEIAEVEREIALRERLYPHWVTTKRLRPDIAERQLAAMRAVLARLRGLKADDDERGRLIKQPITQLEDGLALDAMETLKEAALP